jgi:hypothetical protein
MAMPVSKRDQLQVSREGYEQEGVWMRFLIESYTGSGGYQGRVKQPVAGFWGDAAEAYSGYATLNRSLSGSSAGENSSYLDRFPREDEQKYLRRIMVAHYLNYVRPTTNLMISYIVRKPHKRSNVPDEIADWIERTGYGKDFRRRALATAVLGWFPMLVDMPPANPNALTNEQAGQLDPYTVMCLPCHLRDYQLDEQGNFVWAKMAHVFTRREAWNSEPVKVTRYTIWTAKDFTVYECIGDDEPGEARTGTHPFGRVPLVSWRADTSVEDHVKADSVNADIALEGRRLFNLVSELDEHIRGQVFALLVIPQSSPNGTSGNVDLGTNNGLQISAEQKNLPFFLAPPKEVAATLETRIEKSIIEMYRMRRVEYEKASGTESSAQSKQQNFEITNLSIVDLASSLAQADRETLILVGRGLRLPEEKLQAIQCQPHQSYATEDLNVELEQVLQALTVRELGSRVRVEMLKRLAQQLIPNMDAETKAIVDSEIEDAVKESDQEQAVMRAAEIDSVSSGTDDDDGDENDTNADAAE